MFIVKSSLQYATEIINLIEAVEQQWQQQTNIACGLIVFILSVKLSTRPEKKTSSNVVAGFEMNTLIYSFTRSSLFLCAS